MLSPTGKTLRISGINVGIGSANTLMIAKLSSVPLTAITMLLDKANMIVRGDWGCKPISDIGDFSHHFTTTNLTEAKHTYELDRRNAITLNLDYQQAGLGSASCGPGTRDEYLLRPKSVQFRVRLRPFSVQDESPMALSKQTFEQV